MRYKKSAISSKGIVQAAIRVLARQGYANTSLMDIAHEAGMSKGAIHYHFPTKDTLMKVVVQTACDAVQQRTTDAWVRGGTPIEALHNSLEEVWRIRADRTDEALVVADLLAQSLYVESLRPQLAEFYKIAAEQIGTHLEEHILTLGLKPKIPMSILPRIVAGLLDGLVMQLLVDPNSLDPKEVVSAIETLAISILELEAPSP